MLLHNANDAPDILPLLAGGLGCLRKMRSPRQRRENNGSLQSNLECADFSGLTIFLPSFRSSRFWTLRGQNQLSMITCGNEQTWRLFNDNLISN